MKNRSIRVKPTAGVLIPLLLVCLAFSTTARAVSPPPDEGYPDGNTDEEVISPERETPSVDLLLENTDEGVDSPESQTLLVAEGFNDVNNLPGWFRRNNSQPLGNTNWFQGDPDTFRLSRTWSRSGQAHGLVYVLVTKSSVTPFWSGKTGVNNQLLIVPRNKTF